MPFTLRFPSPLAMLMRYLDRDRSAQALQMASVAQPAFVLRHSNPAGLWQSPRLTQMVEVQGARMIYLSGQTPADENYKVRGADVRTQTHAVYDNIELALRSVNAGWDNVVKTTTYLTSAELIKDFREARMARLGRLKATPANTLLIVSRLAEPEFLVEIDVVAAVPAG
ncbi:MAG: RidA family protein [Betaproteobacteria bacterium]